MTSKAQRRASARYDKAHTKSILFKFNTINDADILAKLDEVGNKQGYVKKLIREDIGENDAVPSIDSLRLMIQPIIRKYGIRKATLFGSYARGEATEESDVDFLIECDSILNMNGYLALVENFRSATGKNVDIVMADALQSDNTRAAQRLKQHIEKDQVVIYERV